MESGRKDMLSGLGLVGVMSCESSILCIQLSVAESS